MTSPLTVIALTLPLLTSGCFGGGCLVDDPCDDDPLDCSDDPTARFELDPACPEPAGPLTVTLGERRGTFEAYDEASPLPFVWGSQGGGHVEVGYAVGGLGYAGGGAVRGLRVSLLLDETIDCAYAGEGDLRPDARGDDASDADGFDTAASDAGGADSGDAGDTDAGGAGDDTGEDDGGLCMRESASRVIIYGTSTLPLRVGADGVRTESGLLLFVNGFAGPQLPARLKVVVEDTCGRRATVAHLFRT
jgi:hypothetical protein